MRPSAVTPSSHPSSFSFTIDTISSASIESSSSLFFAYSYNALTKNGYELLQQRILVVEVFKNFRKCSDQTSSIRFKSCSQGPVPVVESLLPTNPCNTMTKNRCELFRQRIFVVEVFKIFRKCSDQNSNIRFKSCSQGPIPGGIQKQEDLDNQ